MGKAQTMPVFVATERGQGVRGNDFFWTFEGELVMWGSECDGGSIDDNCGCHRALCGMKSHKATTTFTVVQKPMTLKKYQSLFIAAMKSSGWLPKNATAITHKDDYKTYYACAEELLQLAQGFPANMVLERRGHTIQGRKIIDIIVKDGWVLMNSITGKPAMMPVFYSEDKVLKNDWRKEFNYRSGSGEALRLVGGTPPHKPSSTGRVWVRDAQGTELEYFPSVIGCIWKKAEEVIKTAKKKGKK